MNDLMQALGVTPELQARLAAVSAFVTPPTEEDVIATAPAVDLAVKDDWMIPEYGETMNGILVPRRSVKREGGDGYILQPSRVKRETLSLALSLEEAVLARCRYLLWHGYYVRAYARDQLSFTQKDAARRLYWQGQPPPPDMEKVLVDNQIDRAIREKFSQTTLL